MNNFDRSGINSNWTSGSPIALRNFNENDEGNACLRDRGILEVMIDAPDTIFTTMETPTLELPSASPAGGTYSGDFVSGTTFDVASASPGNYEVFYSVEHPTSGCTFSASVIIVVEQTTSVIDPVFDAALKIWPNPTSGQIRIQMDAVDTSPFRVNIRTLQGQLLKTEQLSVKGNRVQHDMSIEELPAGFYLITFENEKGYLANRRLVKQ